MKIAPATLEIWLREYYFTTRIDLGCSGVQNFSFRELRDILGLTQADLDRVVFIDSESLGAPGLRDAIARRWRPGCFEQVMATHGSSEAMYLLMHALLRAGDEVICLDPAYQPLFSIAESVGCELKRWHLRFERGFAPDVDEVLSLITPRTRMVIVNFPHNPTGATLSVEEQKALVQAVEKVGAYLIWDGAFTELTYNHPPLPDPGQWYDRAITLGTLSKTYGLAGLRVGWCLAAPEVLSRCIHLRDYITLYLSPLVELIAQKAIDHADRILEIRLKQARTNLNILTKWIEQHEEEIEWARPRGGVSSFLRLKNVPNVEAFCRQLADEEGTLLVPGNCFNHPQHVRLGFGGATVELEQGLTNLSGLLSRQLEMVL